MTNAVINADDGVSSGTSGLKTTGGDDGILKIQTNGVDAISVSGSQVVTFANSPSGVASLSTASGSAPSYSARAWVNFNGTGTVAIRASGNVSSITDNGTGLYTANFTTSMSDANYAATIGANLNNTNNDTRRTCRVITWSTSSVAVVTGDTSGGASTREDYEFVTITVFR
jgi:hypothetical protein